MITHLFCDIDGTLTDPGRGHDPKLFDVIKKVMKRGITVGLVTGRDAGFAMAFHNIFELNGPIICENGAVMYLNYPRDRNPTILGSIPRKVQEKVVNKCPHYQHNPLKQHTITFYVKNEKKSLKAAEKHIRGDVEALPVVVMQSSSAINVNPEGIDKGSALERYAEIIEVPLENFAFIGDAPNDVPAFEIISKNSGVIAFVGKDPAIIRKYKKFCFFVSKKPNSAGTVEFFNYLLKYGKNICPM